MKFLITLIVPLLFSTSLFAQNFNWDQIDQALTTEAEYLETPYGLYAVLKRIETGPVNHKNYLSGVGGINSDGIFWSSRYEIVSEAWKKVGNHWHIDQWLFTYNLKYQLTFKLHRKMVQTLNSTVLELENIPETDEIYIQKANWILKEWMK